MVNKLYNKTMNYRVLIFLSLSLLSGAVLCAETNPIHIVHPDEGARLPYLDETFVFGSVPPGGKLFINDKEVPVHAGGGFIAMIDLSPGIFSINAKLKLGLESFSLTRKIIVDGPYVPMPVTPLGIGNILPETDAELAPGDQLVVTIKASPGMKSYFTLGKSGKKYSMLETGTPGVYKGSFLVSAADKFKKTKISVTVKNTSTGKTVSKLSEGFVSLFPTDVLQMVEVSTETAVLRSAPSLSKEDKAAYLMFVPQGTVMEVTGKRGDEFRVRLTKNRDVWVNCNEVKPLPEGTPQTSSFSGTISIDGDEKNARVRIPIGQKLPFEILPDMNGSYIDISFFGVKSNTDWINYRSTSTVVRQLKWFQDDTQTYRLRVQVPSRRWWGYDARYEGGSFVFELLSPPVIKKNKKPLEGISVAVDAGHSSDSGAIGPTGLVEKDVNLLIAKEVKEKLLAEGAVVVMTRVGNEPVGLFERPKTAWQYKADIFVSIHNNALADGENPFKKNGYGVYYYNSVSLPLAENIHAEYFNQIGSVLRDDGLHYANLAVTRPTQFPSVLTESAYMIIPNEEAYLKTQDFRSKCAQTIVSGIKRYVLSMRSLPLK